MIFESNTIENLSIRMIDWSINLFFNMSDILNDSNVSGDSLSVSKILDNHKTWQI